MHGIENILMLAEDGELQYFAQLCQGFFQIMKRDGTGRYIYQHNQGELFLHDGLVDVQNICAAFIEQRGNLCDDAPLVIAQYGDDCFCHNAPPKIQ